MGKGPLVHAVFGLSAGGHVVQLLHLAGRPDDRVIALGDELDLGAIDRIDGESRHRSMCELLGDNVWEAPVRIDAFWSEVASSERCVVGWVNRRNATQHAGLLELVRRRGDAPLEIIDVTDVVFPGGGKQPLDIGSAAPALSIELELLDTAAPLSVSARSSYAQTWAQLRAENAPLRIVDNATLVSAPVTHYDTRLVSAVAPKWQSAGWVLGRWYRGFRPPNICFVLSRFAALVAAGQLEGEGDFTLEGVQHLRLRRPRE